MKFSLLLVRNTPSSSLQYQSLDTFYAVAPPRSNITHTKTLKPSSPPASYRIFRKYWVPRLHCNDSPGHHQPDYQQMKTFALPVSVLMGKLCLWRKLQWWCPVCSLLFYQPRCRIFAWQGLHHSENATGRTHLPSVVLPADKSLWW